MRFVILLGFFTNIFNLAATVSDSNACMKKDFVGSTSDEIAKKFADEYSIILNTPKRILGEEEITSKAEIDNMLQLCSCVIFKIYQYDNPDEEFGVRDFNEIIRKVKVERDPIKFPIEYLLVFDYKHEFPSITCKLNEDRCIVAKGPANQSTTGRQEYDLYIGVFKKGDKFRFRGSIEKVDVEMSVYGNEPPAEALLRKTLAIRAINPCMKKAYEVNTVQYLEDKFDEEYSELPYALKTFLPWFEETISENEKNNQVQLCACAILKRMQARAGPEIPTINEILQKVEVAKDKVSIPVSYLYGWAKLKSRFPAIVCDYPEDKCFIAKGPSQQSLSEPLYNLYIGSVDEKDGFSLQGVMKNVNVEEPVQGILRLEAVDDDVPPSPTAQPT